MLLCKEKGYCTKKTSALIIEILGLSIHQGLVKVVSDSFNRGRSQSNDFMQEKEKMTNSQIPYKNNHQTSQCAQSFGEYQL